MKKAVIILMVGSLLFVGCAQHVGPKEGAGTLLGATAGAVLGSHGQYCCYRQTVVIGG